MTGISIPIYLSFYRHTIARVLYRGRCSCCSGERHKRKGTGGKIGVFGTHTIGGTPYTSNGEVTSVRGRKDVVVRQEKERMAIFHSHSFDRSIPDNEKRELTLGLKFQWFL
ncbi:hypothetical protein F5Y12DRAFT_715177 [Xylaria sp. FL1777]|nr:hypothetical protein F5Y12DRAFT_715177 [Xylaria sp. FL1777]